MPFETEAVSLTGLLAHYELDELSGTTASDSVGSADGTLVNYTGSEWTTGVINNALDFNGSNQYVTVNGLAGLLSTGDDYTVAAWFNTTYASAPDFGNQIFSAHTAADANIFRISTTASGGLFYAAGTTDQIHGSGFNDGLWHLVTVARTTTSLTIAVDGTAVAGFTNGSPAWSTATKFSIGQEYDPTNVTSDYFDGLIDDVTIWDRALSLAEAQEIYDLGLLGYSLQAPPVPEPSSFLLLALGALGLVRHTRRRRRSA